MSLCKSTSVVETLSKQQRGHAVQARMRSRSAGVRVRSQRRLARTILLGSVAVGLAIYWLADAYGVEARNLLSALWVSIGFVALLAGLAVMGGLLLGLAKRCWRRGKAVGKPQRREP